MTQTVQSTNAIRVAFEDASVATNMSNTGSCMSLEHSIVHQFFTESSIEFRCGLCARFFFTTFKEKDWMSQQVWWAFKLNTNEIAVSLCKCCIYFVSNVKPRLFITICVHILCSSKNRPIWSICWNWLSHESVSK